MSWHGSQIIPSPNQCQHPVKKAVRFKNFPNVRLSLAARLSESSLSESVRITIRHPVKSIDEEVEGMHRQRPVCTCFRCITWPRTSLTISPPVHAHEIMGGAPTWQDEFGLACVNKNLSKWIPKGVCGGTQSFENTY